MVDEEGGTENKKKKLHFCYVTVCASVEYEFQY
jgi:hypothetical protein